MTAYSNVAAGDVIFASTINDLIASSINRPTCRIMQFLAGTSMASGANTTLSWDTEDKDTHGMHSPSVNPSRVTVTASAGDGIYLCKGTVIVPGRTDYQTLGAVIALNGSQKPPFERVGPSTISGQRSVSVMTELELVVGDYVEVVGFQLNTAAIAVTTQFGGAVECVFEVVKMRGPS